MWKLLDLELAEASDSDKEREREPGHTQRFGPGLWLTSENTEFKDEQGKRRKLHLYPLLPFKIHRVSALSLLCPPPQCTPPIGSGNAGPAAPFHQLLPAEPSVGGRRCRCFQTRAFFITS